MIVINYLEGCPYCMEAESCLKKIKYFKFIILN